MISGESWGWFGEEGFSLEQRLFELGESVALESVPFSAEGTVTARDRDGERDLVLRRGLLEARWPGTPWIGAGISLAAEPFMVSGLRDPLIDSDWTPVDSIRAVSLDLAGILGMRLSATQAVLQGDDSLTVVTVSSPWLGFGSVDYAFVDRTGADSSFHMQAYTVTADLRYARPSVILASNGSGADSTAVLVEVRDIELLDTGWGLLEAVPSAAWAGDSTRCPGGAFEAGRTILGLDILLRPSRVALSAGAGLMLDPSDPGRAAGHASAAMTSEAGVTHRLALDGIGTRGWEAGLSSTLHTGRTSLGGGILTCADSTRVTGTAGYSPTGGVHALLSVGADADGSADPGAELCLAFSTAGGRAALRLHRTGGTTVLSASLCAVFP